MQPLVLASSSQPRKLLLTRLQIPFEAVSPDIDETPFLNESPDAHVMRLAKEKALTVAKQFPDALIIGADIVGILDNIILSKPMTEENAIQQLQMISGKKVRFYSGLCLLNAKNQHAQTIFETFDVFYKKLATSMILNYLKKENPLHCAGSLKIEGLGIALIDQLIGEDITALIGLPLIRLVSMLTEAGITVL